MLNDYLRGAVGGRCIEAMHGGGGVVDVGLGFVTTGVEGAAEIACADRGVRRRAGEDFHAVDPLLIVDGVIRPECDDALFPLF